VTVALVAAAALDDHVLVLFEYDVALVEEVEDGDGRELGRGAAGLGHLARVHQVHQGLDDRVVGRVHVGVEREVALAAAVISVVAVGRDYPVLPLEVAEAHVERLYLAGARVVLDLGVGVGVAGPVVEGRDLGLLLALGLALLAHLPLAQARALEEADHERLLVSGAPEADEADLLGPHLVDAALGRVDREVDAPVRPGLGQPALEGRANVQGDPALAAAARVHRVQVLELALPVREPQHPVGREGEGAPVARGPHPLEAPIEPELRPDEPRLLGRLRHVEPEPLAALVSDARHVLAPRGEAHYHVALVDGPEVLAAELGPRARALLQRALVDVQEELGRGAAHLGPPGRRPLRQPQQAQDLVLDLPALPLPDDVVHEGLVAAVVHVEAARALCQCRGRRRRRQRQHQQQRQQRPRRRRHGGG
jgi:hypothetical protein